MAAAKIRAARAEKKAKVKIKGRNFTMGKILGLLSGIGIGVAMMYMFDPERGKRRRALIRDKAIGLKNDISDMAENRAADLKNRATGMLHEAKSALSKDRSDNTLTEGGQTF